MCCVTNLMLKDFTVLDHAYPHGGVNALHKSAFQVLDILICAVTP